MRTLAQPDLRARRREGLDVWRDVIYAFVALMASYYAYVIPCALLGENWRPMLIPSLRVWSTSAHVIVLCATWVAFKSPKILIAAGVAILILNFSKDQFLGFWPSRGYALFWPVLIQMILQDFVAPIIAVILLLAQPGVSGWLFKEGHE